jgi:hypothetical protein
MTATDYAPGGPLDTAPAGPFTPPEDRRQAFLSALAGVELGTYDDQIIDWLSGLDDPTCRTIVSLIRRAREAAREAGWQDALDHDGG